jgi:hypothetical protein
MNKYGILKKSKNEKKEVVNAAGEAIEAWAARPEDVQFWDAHLGAPEPAERVAMLQKLYIARIGAMDFTRTLMSSEKVCKLAYQEAVIALQFWESQRRISL